MMMKVFTAFLMSLASSQSLTFTNPIFDGYSSNVCILKIGDFYYLTPHDLSQTELTIYKSSVLTNFRNVEKHILLKAPDGYGELDPSEMIVVNGELYIYFRMNSAVGSRMFVMKANNPLNPMEGWSEPIRLLNDWDYQAADGTVMKQNDHLYFVWTNVSSINSLFIAPMTSPTWVGNPKVLLKEPKEVWECRGKCNNLGSTFLYNRNVSYLIYSASNWNSPDFCVSQMSISDSADPLVPENWRIANEPVFWRNDEQDVYAVGRPEFTLSPDGTETWMVYHASASSEHVIWRQTARLDKIEWNEDGSPIFPRPVGNHQLKLVPSGQVSLCPS